MRKAIQPHVLGAGERGPRGRDTVPVHCGPSVSLATHDQPSNLTARNTDGETGCKVNDAPHERACSTLLTTQNEDQPGWPTTGECLSTRGTWTEEHVPTVPEAAAAASVGTNTVRGADGGSTQAFRADQNYFQKWITKYELIETDTVIPYNEEL